MLNIIYQHLQLCVESLGALREPIYGAQQCLHLEMFLEGFEHGFLKLFVLLQSRVKHFLLNMGVRIKFGFDLSEKLLMLLLALCSLDLLEQLMHFSVVFLQ
jgi:hypothetical protein